jgi:hypothetical protein
MKTFYVCSYGGSGSWMLYDALSKYGNVVHIHSREPPVSLEYTGNQGGGDAYHEWFNGIKISDNKLDEYYVIYLYRNPIYSIYSRFVDHGIHNIKDHLKHIQCPNIDYTLKDIIKQKQDLYKLEEFHRNYTQTDKDRNYKIYCVNYKEIFEKQDELSSLLGIGKLNLIKKETKRDVPSNERIILNDIYKDLIDTMNNNDFISVI